jgi:hypothetical protein
MFDSSKTQLNTYDAHNKEVSRAPRRHIEKLPR